MGARFGIENMRGRWDAKNNPRYYGIARNFGSVLRDRKTLMGTLFLKKGKIAQNKTDTEKVN